jgi:hypothetical protein
MEAVPAWRRLEVPMSRSPFPFPIRWALLCMAFLFVAPAHAADPPAGRRIALSGYDPVAYFIDGKPVKGVRGYWHAFDDSVYLFRSATHRDLFAAQPERYAPQYSGFCAGGVSKGYKTEPDPEAWLIANGRLFVFQYKDRVEAFRQKIAEIEAQANANWPVVRKK